MYVFQYCKFYINNDDFYTENLDCCYIWTFQQLTQPTHIPMHFLCMSVLIAVCMLDLSLPMTMVLLSTEETSNLTDCSLYKHTVSKPITSVGKDLQGREAAPYIKLMPYCTNGLISVYKTCYRKCKIIVNFKQAQSVLALEVNEHVGRSISAYIMQVIIDVILGGHFISFIFTEFSL